MVITSVYNTMSFDEVEHLLNILARHKCGKQRAIDDKEFDRREAALAARECAQLDSRKSYYKKLATLHSTIADLQRRNDEMTGRLDRMRAERNAAILDARQYEVDAKKYRTIKDLLVDK